MCAIDFCGGDDDTELAVDRAGESFTLNFCLTHAMQLEERLSQIKGVAVDLVSGPQFATPENLMATIDYLNDMAKLERAN